MKSFKEEIDSHSWNEIDKLNKKCSVCELEIHYFKEYLEVWREVPYRSKLRSCEEILMEKALK